MSEKMNRNLITLLGDNEIFLRAVSSLWEDAERFSLTVQSQLGVSEHLNSFLFSLAPWLICETETNHWPGTVLYGGEAKVMFFQCTTLSLSTIAAQASLWFWLQPEMPEDLAIYRKDGSVIFESLCHEKDVLLHLAEDEIEGLPASIRARMIHTGRQEE